MKMSEGTDKIFAAFAKVQGSIQQPAKNGQSHFGAYVTLDDVVKSIHAAEGDTGISFMQNVVTSDKGVEVSTIITHSSGQWVMFDPIIMPLGKRDAQAVGSAETYGRRYALSAAFGIVSDQDDDGEGAMPQQGQQQQYHRQQSRTRTSTNQQQQRQAPPKKTNKQKIDEAMSLLIKATGMEFKAAFKAIYMEAGVEANNDNYVNADDHTTAQVVAVATAKLKDAQRQGAGVA